MSEVILKSGQRFRIVSIEGETVTNYYANTSDEAVAIANELYHKRQQEEKTK